MRPPIIVWITAFFMLVSGLALLGAVGLEAWAVTEDEGSYLPWAVLGGLAAVQLVGSLFMPIAARWSTLLCWLVTMATGLGGIGAGWMMGTGGLFGLAWPIYAGVLCLGSAFFAFVSFFFVHQYQTALEDMY